MDMDMEVDGMDDPVASANGAIEALCSLVRNTRINNRAYVCAATIAVFVRLSCFRDGHTKGMAHKDANPQVGKKKTKKNEAQIDDMPTLDGLNAEIIDVIQLVEGTTGGSNNNNSSSGSSSSGSGAFHVSTEIAELAGAKLMAILADIGNQTLTQLNTPNPAVVTAEEREKEKGARRKKDNESLASEGHHSTLLLDVAIAAVDYLSTLGGLELVRSEEEAEEEEDYSLVMTAFTSALTSMKELAPAAVPSLSLLTDPALALAILSGAGTSNGQKVKTIVAAVDVDATDSDASISNSNSNSNSSTEGVDKLRLRESLYQLLGHAVFHCLTSSVVSLESLKDMADVSVRIVAEVNGEEAVTDAKRHKHSDDDEDDDEDEDEDERPQSILFDASMEMLSVSGDHAVKGVRDAIKRAWNALCQVRIPAKLILLSRSPFQIFIRMS